MITLIDKIVVLLLLVHISSGKQLLNSWSDGFEETLINPKVLKENVLNSKNNTKYWASYINKSVSNSMKHTLFVSKNNSNTFTCIKLESYQRVFLLDWWKISGHVYYLEMYSNASIVKMPIGQILVGTDDCQLFETRPEKVIECVSLFHIFGHMMGINLFSQSFQWTFKLDHHIKLNITFQYIKIMAKSLRTCFIGYVSVEDLTENCMQQKYCGVHSNAVNCPPFALVAIVLTIKPLVTFQMHTLYSVMDKRQVESISHPTNMSSKPEWAVLFVGTKLWCEKYSFHQEKTHILHIVMVLISGYWMEIFDGPGTLSQQLRPTSCLGNQRSYLTSSFQCIVFVYYTSDFVPSAHAKSGFQFQVNEQQEDQEIFVNKPTALPQCITFSGHVCATKLTAKEHFHISVTVNNLTTSYKRNELCTFGGLAAYEGNTSSKAHIVTSCFQFSNVFRDRTIYSSNNSLLIILYSYQVYGSLNISVNISTTTCSKRTIDACTTAGTTVIPLAVDTCVIIQMQNKLDVFTYNRTIREHEQVSCDAQVVEFNATSPDWAEIKLLITGYLQGNHKNKTLQLI